MISLCMITYNEEKYLKKCLESIRWPISEIIVVDTGSSDKTIEIAKSFDARVFCYPLNDNFSAARNYSISKATNPWILVLDADEYLSNDDIDKLEDQIEIMENENCLGSRLWRYDYYKNGGWSISSITRLFKNNPNVFYERSVNETISFSIKKTGSKIMVSDLIIHHLGFLKDSNYIDYKQKKYINLLKKDISFGDDSLRYYYAKEHLILHDTTIAHQICDEAYAIKKKPRLINLKGDIFLDENSMEKAQIYFKKVFELEIENNSKFFWHAVDRLAEISFIIGDYEKALMWLQHLEKTKEISSYVFANKGFIYENMGKYNEAINCYKIVESKNPEIDKILYYENINGYYTDTFKNFCGIRFHINKCKSFINI